MKQSKKQEPDLRLVDEALEREGLTVVGSAEERIDRLRVHYEARPAHELADCSECGFATPADDPACAFCGHSDGETGLTVADASPSLALQNVEEAEKKLDQAIGRYAAAGRDMVGSGWDMGNAVREILDNRLYLARRGPKGEPLYRNFWEFCRAELNRSAVDVRRMIAIASEYTRQEAVEIGTTKLGIVLKIADPSKRAPILDMARDPDVSVRQLSEATREIVKESPREVARDGLRMGGRANPRPRKPPAPIFPPAPFISRPAQDDRPAGEEKPKRAKRLSISVEEGEHQVLLYAQRTSPTDQRRAREIADKPAGRIRFLNGTQMRVILLRSEKGLFAKLEFTEAPEDEE